MVSRSLVLVPLVLLLAVASAAAVTVSELTATATAVNDSYTSLKARVDADAESHDVLLADYNSLETQRAQVHHDRGTLPASCGCSCLDTQIAGADQKSSDIQRVIDTWDETP